MDLTLSRIKTTKFGGQPHDTRSSGFFDSVEGRDGAGGGGGSFETEGLRSPTSDGWECTADEDDGGEDERPT